MEKALKDSRSLADLREFVEFANRNKDAEFEAKLLAGRIVIKNVAERIRKSIESFAGTSPTEEHRLTYGFDDNLRVSVLGVDNIMKVCNTKSFAKVPAIVERKTPYFQSEGPMRAGYKAIDKVDVPDYYARFTLRHEKFIRNDYAGPVDDRKARIRMIHRLSWVVPSDMFRIDFSMVKSGNGGDTLNNVLKMPVTYELEVEYLPNRDNPYPTDLVIQSMTSILERLIGAFQGSEFVLPESRIKQYAEEFSRSDARFYNLVTLERKNLTAGRVGNILSGYTVTNKADGERSGLYVTRDRHLIRVNDKGQVVWTGITVRDDSHAGDFVDGEYIVDKNLFCIFDIYRFRKNNVKGLPLMLSEDAPLESSRLGCAKLFVQDIASEFVSQPAGKPFRVETKLFRGGDGIRMEEAIASLLATEFEYPTDGLIFTPRASPVAPAGELKGRVWTRVYKWKPPAQNTIDFLLRMEENKTVYDPELRQDVVKGILFVSSKPGNDIVYPCETLTGEYVAPQIPADLSRIMSSAQRVPAVFQPSAPRDPNAHVIHIPLNPRKVPLDAEGVRVDNDTIVECSFNTDTRKWTILRTRYDKTYEYRVLKKPQYGNDVTTADNVWTSIHAPITDDMLKSFVTRPIDDTYEDDLYYRDDVESGDRAMKDVAAFHNRIKEGLYRTNVQEGTTLLELGVGRAGDLHKWKKVKPSKVVGIEISETNLSMPRQGACARYLKEKRKEFDFLPKALFVQGDFTKPFEEQHNRYMDILFGREAAPTPYLREFENLTQFDNVSCQFVMTYACESEEMFKIFVGNVAKHCKSTFFGTIADGKSIYTLLAGKTKHVFRKNGTVFAEYAKKYDDSGAWTNEFGQQVELMMESLEKPQTEFLIPFDKVVELFGEAGFDLAVSELFTEPYERQNAITLSPAEQEFSFVNRTFVFKRRSAPPPAVEEPEAKEEVELEEPAPAEEEKKEEEAPGAPAAAPPKRRKRIVPKAEVAPPGEPPVFFFSKLPENKEFSNFFEVEFELDGVKFKSAEHAYQYAKAKTFGDEDIAAKILKAKSAQSAKAFGKKVANFLDATWDSKKDDVMLNVLRAKFRTNPDIRKKLLDTGDRVLAEADPRGKYWGIGTSADTSKAKDPSKWVGQNKLGKLLMDVRTELKKEEST